MRLVQAAARAAAALALTAVALTACGTDGGAAGSAGPLRWVGEATVIRPEALPEDRIVTGRVRNDSLEPVQLDARALELVDDDGEPVRSSAAFLDSFGRAWDVYNKGPLALPRDEWRRLGRLVRIDPGQTMPLTVSWSGGPPTRIVYRGGSLALP